MCSRNITLRVFIYKEINVMFYIYKITNLVNNKIYIGLTTTSVEERWKGHKRVRFSNKKPLYKAMLKYGIENFKIEEIDSTDSLTHLGELERYYIKLYDSTNPKIGYNLTHGGESNQMDGNPRARLTVDDVKEIRKTYASGEVSVTQHWKDMYQDKISYSAFEKIWEGTTWKNIMPEVYTSENKLKQTNFRKNGGEKNGNAILTNDEVLEIRKYYVTHTLQECYEKYGAKYNNKISFRRVIDESYSNVPFYCKRLKKWIKPGDEKPKRLFKNNTYKIEGESLYVDMYDDYGMYTKTFVTDKVFIDIVKQHTWFYSQNTVVATINKIVTPIYKLILNIPLSTTVYKIDGNPLNMRKNNLKIKAN